MKSNFPTNEVNSNSVMINIPCRESCPTIIASHSNSSKSGVACNYLYAHTINMYLYVSVVCLDCTDHYLFQSALVFVSLPCMAAKREYKSLTNTCCCQSVLRCVHGEVSTFVKKKEKKVELVCAS